MDWPIYNLLRNRIVGSKGNLWDNDLVAYNGTSSVVDTQNLPNISIMINIYSDEENTITANATVNFEGSPDGTNWTYCTQISENLPQGSASEAHVYHTVGARYIRLARADTDGDDDVYITASLQAKP